MLEPNGSLNIDQVCLK